MGYKEAPDFLWRDSPCCDFRVRENTQTYRDRARQLYCLDPSRRMLAEANYVPWISSSPTESNPLTRG